MKTVKAVILSISDTRQESEDVSGDMLAGLLLESGAEVVGKLMVSDDLDDLIATLTTLADNDEVNLVVTTGGTGLGPRDNTPEATRAVIEKEAPGMAEAMRIETLRNTPMAMLSRGVCGVRGRTLIVNLPGSPKGVSECYRIIEPVLEHAVGLAAGRTSH